MSGFRVVLRGLSDTLEHLLPFTLATLGWWLGVLLVVPAPGATLTLFRITDPRTGTDVDRPTWRESAGLVWRNLRRGWALTLLTLPMPVLLVYNLVFYDRTDSLVSLLAPLWLFLFALTLAIGLSAFAIAALRDQPARAALRQAFVLTGAHLPRALIAVVLLWLLLAAGALLVVPVVMFLPATVAATINRLVLVGLGIPIVDPLAPTEERRLEEQRAKGGSRFGP